MVKFITVYLTLNKQIEPLMHADMVDAEGVGDDRGTLLHLQSEFKE